MRNLAHNNFFGGLRVNHILNITVLLINSYNVFIVVHFHIVRFGHVLTKYSRLKYMFSTFHAARIEFHGLARLSSTPGIRFTDIYRNPY